MKTYFVNTEPQSTGEHEVHESGCSALPGILNRKYLGTFSHCRDAVTAARKHYSAVDGCRICSYACHSR